MKLFTTLLALGMLATGQLFAQNTCDDGRFSNREYFHEDSIQKTGGIQFGENTAVGGGGMETLEMDLYDVASDTLSERPVVMLAFGGSFVGGARGDVEGLCRAYAEMGYLAISIDYRVGVFFPINERSTTLAVMRGLHDMKAAIRFLYKDRQTDNLYRVDTNRIFIGGVSAGAITAIHTAYLDQQNEIPSYFQPSDTAGLGGIEGNSGNPGYSSKVAGVISYSGTIGDTNWIQPGDAPIVMFHDSVDNTVPLGTGIINALGVNTGLTANGTGSMQYRFQNIGVDYDIRIFPGSGHVSYLNINNTDTVLNQSKNFIEPYACKETNTVGIYDVADLNNAISIYPNPSSGVFNIDLGNSTEANIEVYNLLGKLVTQEHINGSKASINLSSQGKGLYVVYVKDPATGNALSVNKLMVDR